MANVFLRLLVLKTHHTAVVCAFYQSLGLTFTEEKPGKGPLHHSAPLGGESLKSTRCPPTRPSIRRLGLVSRSKILTLPSIVLSLIRMIAMPLLAFGATIASRPSACRLIK